MLWIRPRQYPNSAIAVYPRLEQLSLKPYHGQTLEVKILENGFEYHGKIYKSISRVAMDIVKRPISGYVFFGLTK